MTVNIANFRNNIADALNRVAYGGERVVLARRGKGVVALVSMNDLATLERLEDESDLKAALKARKEKGKIPLKKIKARLGMK